MGSLRQMFLWTVHGFQWLCVLYACVRECLACVQDHASTSLSADGAVAKVVAVSHELSQVLRPALCRKCGQHASGQVRGI